MDITQSQLISPIKLSLILPEKTSLDTKFYSKDYSGIILLYDDNTIKIIKNLNLSGSYGSVYDGTINGKNCIIKISHDILNNYSFDTYNKCVSYENEFLKLSEKLLEHNIIPAIYLFKCLSDFDYLIFKKKKYNNDKFNNSINTQYNECIYVLCTEKYHCDLFKLYENNILENNKCIIENKLLDIFIKLNNLKYIYTDMKMENIVVKINKDNIVTSVKIIDMDPNFCFSFDNFFQKNPNIDHNYIIDNIIMIYKYIFYKRSNNILFVSTFVPTQDKNQKENNIDILNIYNNIFEAIEINNNNKNAIYNIHNLIFN